MMGAAWGFLERWRAGVAHAATAGLIAAVWQGALLSLVVALGLRLLPKTPAALRFAIWFGVFAVVALLPSAALIQSAGVANGHAAWFVLDERWCVIVAAVWAIASLMRSVTLLLAVLRVRTLWKRAAPLEVTREEMVDAVEPHRFARLRKAGSRHAELCVSDEVDRPTVIGFFAPKILIPEWLVEKLTAVELEQIVLHETGHLSRADDWMNLLQKIALVVFPLNPALAWVERRLCFERELACDERVLETTGAPKAYAACLASLAEHRMGQRGLALALGALGRESELGRRVRRILCRGERMRPVHAKLVLGGTMLGLLAAAAGLERCPKLVGFTNADAGTIAATEPLMERGPKFAYSYQPVVFHPQAASTTQVQVGGNATRHLLFIARSGRVRSKPAPAVPELLRADAGPATEFYSDSRDMEKPASGEVSQSDIALYESELQAHESRVVQWVVVILWRGDDGSRMVRTASTNAKTSDSRSAADDGAPQDQVHPYAAVPVQNGWLVFQL